RSFIDGLGQDPHDTSIVEAIVALGRALGMRVHAEGVERCDQLEELRRIGCDEAQGWLWAPAMPPREFEGWMAERSPAVATPRAGWRTRGSCRPRGARRRAGPRAPRR